jgi:hypothetical protein
MLKIYETVSGTLFYHHKELKFFFFYSWVCSSSKYWLVIDINSFPENIPRSLRQIPFPVMHILFTWLTSLKHSYTCYDIGRHIKGSMIEIQIYEEELLDTKSVPRYMNYPGLFGISLRIEDYSQVPWISNLKCTIPWEDPL